MRLPPQYIYIMGPASRLHDYKGLDDAERVPGKARDEGRPRRLVRVANERPNGKRKQCFVLCER